MPELSTVAVDDLIQTLTVVRNDAQNAWKDGVMHPLMLWNTLRRIEREVDVALDRVARQKRSAA